ncbi:MAG: hypothetical protein JRL30_08225 [Deltaproteobacteria bacterium]|nr:hypothetical protein [Deltaproteobacteria bacterium]
MHRVGIGSDAAGKEADFPVCAPCTRDEAREWAADAEKDGWSALKAASCYAFLVKQGADEGSRLSDAKKGRQLAETGIKQLPQSGLAHYLVAYLTGLEAENDTLRGLELVPIIEREARIASQLNASIDYGGPDRMLGELYLRAPVMPVSIGDVEKGVIHYQRAFAIAPEYADNQMGLVETLLEAGDVKKACTHLHELLSNMPPARSSEATWRKALGLLKRLCTEGDSE